MYSRFIRVLVLPRGRLGQLVIGSTIRESAGFFGRSGGTGRESIGAGSYLETGCAW